MSFKTSLEEIFNQYKEAEFAPQKDIEKDLFDKSREEIIDGLMKDFNNDENLVLRALNKTIKDEGYADKHEKILAVKDQIEKMKEANNKNSEFKNLVEKILDEEDSKYAKPDFMHQDSFIDTQKDAGNIKEMLAYAKNGIHPHFVYGNGAKTKTKTQPMWRYLGPNGEKLVFVITGIDKDTDYQNTFVYIKPVSVGQAKSGAFVKNIQNSYIKVPVAELNSILRNDLNRNVYQKLLGKDPDEPQIWVKKILNSDDARQRAFWDWVIKSRDILDLDSFDRRTVEKMYLDMKKGYSTQELRNKYKNLAKKENVEELEEAMPKASEIQKDKGHLKDVVSELGINPLFVDFPIIKEYPDMGDDTEPTLKIVIVGAPKIPSGEITELYVRDWDNGGRMYPFSVEEILELQERPENANPGPDIWDAASTMNKQRRGWNSGTTGRWEDLTDGEVIDVLTQMEQREEFKGIKLVDKYTEPQTFETRNPLVTYALKAFDPEVSVRPMRSKTGRNGISYKIFIPDDGKSKAPLHGGRNNPYTTLTKYY